MHDHPLAKPTIYVNSVPTLRLRRAVLRLIGPKRRLRMLLRTMAILVALGGAFSLGAQANDEQPGPGPNAERACFLMLRRSRPDPHVRPELDTQRETFGPSFHTSRDVSPMLRLECSWTPEEDEHWLSDTLVAALVEPTLPGEGQ